MCREDVSDGRTQQSVATALWESSVKDTSQSCDGLERFPGLAAGGTG